MDWQLVASYFTVKSMDIFTVYTNQCDLSRSSLIIPRKRNYVGMRTSGEMLIVCLHECDFVSILFTGFHFLFFCKCPIIYDETISKLRIQSENDWYATATALQPEQSTGITAMYWYLMKPGVNDKRIVFSNIAVYWYQRAKQKLQQTTFLFLLLSFQENKV